MNALPMTPFALAVAPAILAGFAKQKGIPVKTLVGAFVYALALSLVGSWNGEVANALAWLIAITSILLNGATLFKIVDKAV